MKNVKYYMNNPCEVLRKINEEFSEIVVYPQFDEDMNGGQWCVMCMVGHGGTPSSHTCDEYQEVLDVIRDSEPQMIVVVENRLLVDQPVEFKAFKALREEIEKDQKKRGKLLAAHFGLMDGIRKQEEKARFLEKEISDLERKHQIRESKEADLYRKLVDLRSTRDVLIDQVSIGGVRLKMNAGELRNLIKASIKLERLEQGGVDNWQWYGDSLPSHDEIELLADKEIQSMKIAGIN